jgi:hypothetical protein
MTDFAQILATLRRPRLLIRAAHHGLADYNRNRDLKRLLSGQAPAPREAVARLIDEERALEEARRNGGAAYSVARHVDVMIAILAEMRLVNRQQAV